MQRRIYTYVTTVAGIPTVAGTYFDAEFSDLSVMPSSNVQVSESRDGTGRLIVDPMYQFERRAQLTDLTQELIDLPSIIPYAGATRYLGPVLYLHHRAHFPICIFQRSFNATAQKAYLAYLLSCDPVLVAHMTTQTGQQHYFGRVDFPRILSFDLEIVLDGLFTDFDDITAVGWNART